MSATLPWPSGWGRGVPASDRAQGPWLLPGSSANETTPATTTNPNGHPSSTSSSTSPSTKPTPPLDSDYTYSAESMSHSRVSRHRGCCIPLARATAEPSAPRKVASRVHPAGGLAAACRRRPCRADDLLPGPPAAAPVRLGRVQDPEVGSSNLPHPPPAQAAPRCRVEAHRAAARDRSQRPRCRVRAQERPTPHRRGCGRPRRCRRSARGREGINASGLSPERQARLLVDDARAHAKCRHAGEALAGLLDAESMAPEHVRSHLLARGVVADLLDQRGRRPPDQLLALARRCGATRQSGCSVAVCAREREVSPGRGCVRPRESGVSTPELVSGGTPMGTVLLGGASE